MELLQLLLASIILLVTGTAVLLLLIGFFPRLADQERPSSSGRPAGHWASGWSTSFS